MLKCLLQLLTPNTGEDVQTKLCYHSETSDRRCWVSLSGLQPPTLPHPPTLAMANFFAGFDQRRAQPLSKFAFLMKGAPTRSDMIESSLAPLRVAAWFAVCLTRPVLRSQCPELPANLLLLVCIGLYPFATMEVSAKAVYWRHLKTPLGVLKILFPATIGTGMAMRQEIGGDNRIELNKVAMG